jgi:hypothetical protein
MKTVTFKVTEKEHAALLDAQNRRHFDTLSHYLRAVALPAAANRRKKRRWTPPDFNARALRLEKPVDVRDFLR